MQFEPDWRRYEREIHAELTSNYPDALIRHDVRLPGFLSARPRQVDILVEEDLPGGRVATAIADPDRVMPLDLARTVGFGQGERRIEQSSAPTRLDI